VEGFPYCPVHYREKTGKTGGSTISAVSTTSAAALTFFRHHVQQ